MYIAIVGLGFTLIALEIVAARKNRSFAAQRVASREWAFAYRWRLLFGIPLAVASAFIQYPIYGEGERYQVAGFPCMVAAFDSAGRDYVGPLSVPSWIANGLLWLFFPAVILWIWSWFKRDAVHA